MVSLGDPKLPFPKRSDLMYLDVVKPTDIPAENRSFSKSDSASLRTSDIPKCTTQSIQQKYFNKPNLFQTADISGCQPAKYFSRPMKTHNSSLTTADIDLAYPSRRGFADTSRHVCPLNPEYVLPSFELLPPTQPKFIRDNLDVADISKARTSKEYCLHRRVNRNPADGTDIDGSTPNHLRTKAHFKTTSHTKPFYALMSQDINASITRQARPRGTNPLQPSYFLQDWNRPTHCFSEDRYMAPVTPQSSLNPKAHSTHRHAAPQRTSNSDFAIAHKLANCDTPTLRVSKNPPPLASGTSQVPPDLCLPGSRVEAGKSRQQNPGAPFTTAAGGRHVGERYVRIGSIDRSKPRNRMWDNGAPQYSLLTQDVPGATPARLAKD
eukprot:GHVQ01019393.1.p1 GENE.GHVQ01019393.1~~GHVQ01019393.1.p1  ORF type:complete len:380 (+),score=28.00 GHVQ01019393.1:227-1366(+)